ncbi:glycoside hydrolase family 2, partial [bacterium]
MASLAFDVNCHKMDFSMTRISAAFLLAVSLLTATVSRADRQRLDWNTGWKFIGAEAQPSDSTTDWATVQIPHTWNVDNYRRGAGWYAKSFSAPTTWKNKRVFIAFEAVSIAADVYLNGNKLQRHEGAFTAFCVELTSGLKWNAPNELRVRADNSRLGIAPYSADFNFNGGIYRPVHLLVTDASCISPLDYGSPGVYITPRSVEAGKAEIEIKTIISSTGGKSEALQIEAEILDAKGKSVARGRTSVLAGASPRVSALQLLSIAQPRLWNGLKDPYLYSVRVRLRSKTSSDEMTQPLGIRTLGFDADERFVLNGALYSLHGVNRHQDLRGKAWAVSDADHAADIALIKEIGATTIRLAHYPQSRTFLDMCDQTGFILWEEIPVVNRIFDDAKFSENARLQLTEMIMQGYNHPSIGMWGLFNEVTAPGPQLGF